jgi:hypothetical protein
MVSRPDNRSFDLFLLLWRRYLKERSGASSSITVKLDDIASDLAMDMEKGRTAYRRQIIKSLRKLQSRYGLIECRIDYGGPVTVSFTWSPSSVTPVNVPAEYWEYGWPGRLNLSAKALYLICLVETESSPNKPWWTLSHKAIAKKYSLKYFTVNHALRELEYHDLLHVRRNPAPQKQFDLKRPNNYKLRPLLSPEEIERQWKKLEDTYGSEMLEEARKCAAHIEGENSREVVGRLLPAIEKHGAKKVEAAAAKTGEMPADNPYRNVGYILHLLEKGEEE